MSFKIGQKVRTKPTAFTKVTGVIVAIHQAKPSGYSACAAIYCGKYESVLVPLSDLIILG